MLFPTYQFIFLFLPIALITFYFLYWRGQASHLAAVLLVFSLIFYLLPNWMHGHIIIASIVINFWLSKKIQEYHDPISKALLTIGVMYNLGVIGYYKYSFFFGEIYTHFSGKDLGLLKFVLPVGISFYTFQQIAYLVDCYRYRDTKYKLHEYAVFVAFFPQLIAGPIVHHREIMPQVAALKTRRFNPMLFNTGLSMFVIGLFKKLALADNLANLADPVFQQADAGTAVDTLSSWVGTMAYTLQLYFDFSAYSDMAIGLGLMFGLKLPINFLSPYKATSIVDFWRRWHITLSRFLRDYLYIALGGNRRGKVRRYANLMATMLLGGLWHGAGWNFILWGGLHGCYLVINHFFTAMMKAAQIRLPRPLSMGITLSCVMVAWVFFRAETHSGAMVLLAAMFGGGAMAPTFEWVAADFILLLLGWFVVLGLPNVAELFAYKGAETPEGWRPDLIGGQSRRANVLPVLVGVLFAGALMFAPQPTVFIYFNF